MASRTSNSIKNIASNLGLKFLVLGLQFATRTIFINNLGSVYNGINSLVGSVLSFLNMAELGIGAAIVFAMYKPVAENDEEKILQYMSFYKKVYHLMGGIVFLIGLAFMPMMPFFVKDVGNEINMGQVYVVYILYFINVVSSFYVYSYRGGLITAYQQDYRLTPINYTANILIIVLQCVSLIVLKGIISFYVYTAIPIFLTMANRIINGLCAAKWYPYLKRKPTGKLSKEEVKSIYKNVFGLAISKLCTIINNSVDSMVISALIGVTILGKYHNYHSLILMVNSFVGVFFTSLVSSVGNLNVNATKEHSKKIFNAIHFTSFIIYGICTVCYFNIVQSFVPIWIGQENLLADYLMIGAISVNFLTEGMCNAVAVYRAGCGLYHQGRYRPIFTVFFNVLLSIVLGKYIGISGIVIATIVSRFVTIWWFDAYIVYKHVFKEKPYKYLLDYMLKILFIAVVCVVVYYVCSLVNLNGWSKLIANALISLILSSAIFIICFCRNEEFIYMKNKFSGIIKKIGKK